MKKIIFLLVFSLISHFSFSQMVARTYKNKFGTWDEMFKKWRFDEDRYANISIRVEKTFFQFDDEAQSLYRVIESEGEKLEKTYKATTWVCKDEKNTYCRVQVIHYYENIGNVFAVIYDKVCYIYYIKDVEDYSNKN